MTSARARGATATPYPFEPSGGASRACTVTSASVALSGSGEQALVTNWGAVTAFVEFGTSSVAATTSSLAVLPATAILVTIPETSTGVKATHVAGITNAGTTTIQVHTGWGL